MRIATLALTLTVSLPAYAESPAEASAETLAETALRLLRETLAADHGPGTMTAAVRGGCLVLSDAGGYADLEQKVPLTTNTRMRIGFCGSPGVDNNKARRRDGRRSAFPESYSVRKVLPRFATPNALAIARSQPSTSMC